MNITITCDRCGATVEGIRSSFEYEGRIIKTTGGFYDLMLGWERFAQSGEQVICDKCMWADPLYAETYSVPNAK